MGAYSQTTGNSNTNSNNNTNSSTQEQIQNRQDEIEELEKKEQSYRKMIDLKKTQAQTLQNQMRLMDSEIGNLETDIGKIEEIINKNEVEIDLYEKKIETKKGEIKDQKLILGELLQNYYENEQDSIIEMVLKNANFSDFLSEAEYISQTSSKVDEVLSSLTESKAILDDSKKNLEIKNNEQREQRGTIAQKKNVLEGEKRRLSIHVVIVDDEEIRRIHRLFLNDDDVTDVIAFPEDDANEEPAEIYISLDQARLQSLEDSESVEKALARLLVHGVLHLCGWEDDTDEHKAAMLAHGEQYL